MAEPVDGGISQKFSLVNVPLHGASDTYGSHVHLLIPLSMSWAYWQVQCQKSQGPRLAVRSWRFVAFDGLILSSFGSRRSLCRLATHVSWAISHTQRPFGTRSIPCHLGKARR